jgi:hypothetical protein
VAAEEVRTRLRRRLMEEYGMDEADLLLDRPPGGWNDVVTKDWLHLELGASEARTDARFAEVNGRLTGVEARLGAVEQVLARMDSRLDELARDVRSQTWRLVSVFVVVMGFAIGVNKV